MYSLFQVFLNGLAFIHGAVNRFHRIDEHLLGEWTDQVLGYKLWHSIYQCLETKQTIILLM